MKTDVLERPVASDAQPAQMGLKPRLFWRMGEPLPAPLDRRLRMVSIAIPLALWWLVSSLGLINPTFFPSPVAVVMAFGDLLGLGSREAVFWGDLQASLLRVGIGFLLAAVVSVPIGIAMGAFASVRALLEPIIGVVRYMPAPAFAPLLIVYLGVDEAPKIALIFIGVVFFNILMIMDAVKFVPKHLLETTYTLGGDRWQTLMQVITPYVVPNIIDAFRINMAAAWNLVVVAELLAATAGLGKRIELARKVLGIDTIFAYLIVLGLIGFTLDLCLRLLLKFTCKWAVD